MNNYDLALAKIGEIASRLWTDHQFAWSQLNAPDWKIRYFSFAALVERWDLSKREVFAITKSLIGSRPHDELLLINILGILADAFYGDFNKEVSTYVANIVNGNDWPNSMRVKAFLVLKSINTPKSTFLTAGDILDSGFQSKFYGGVKQEMESIVSGDVSVINWAIVNEYLA